MRRLSGEQGTGFQVVLTSADWDWGRVIRGLGRKDCLYL